VEVELRDENGRPVPEGRVGRVFARGPSVMSGYFEAPEATAAVLQDGWLDTGDLGFLQEGELHLSGRAKDLIIVRGANHAPQEFEECLDAVEGVRTGCAVALGFVPEGGSEELLVLAEVTESTSGPSTGSGRTGGPSTGSGRAGGPSTGSGRAGDLEERIRAAVLQRTGIRPHTVKLLSPGTLPRTSSGKLRRSEALRRFLADELSAPLRPTPLRLAMEMAKSAVALARTRFDD
jgi:acyl-CoA synthetase (AMP-forming)/AMP-acid ligase II